MTLREILLEKEQRLESVPDAFASKVEKAQKELLRELIKQLDSLDRTGGQVDATVANIARIEEITQNLTRYLFDSTDYTEALKEFTKEFSTQAKLNREYMAGIIEDFENKELYKATLQQSQKQTLEMFGKAGINQQLMIPMKDILASSITGGSSFSDMVQVLSDYMVGNKEKLGRLESYSKQIAYDSFAFSDAKYLHTVSEDLDFEWFEYFGGQLEDSRCFCAKRNGHIFHKNEVEHWGETPSLWDKTVGCEKGGGRVPATDKATIFVYRGGYNCRHQIVPVAESSVPKSAKDAAIKGGFITA